MDGTFYIGYSSDVERRLAEQNAGLSRYTSKKIPWKIFYTESYSLKSEAIKRERFLSSKRIRIPRLYQAIVELGKLGWKKKAFFKKRFVSDCYVDRMAF